MERRYEAQNFLVHQIHRIPFRRIRNESITAEQIRQILKEQLEFDELRHWLKNKKNQLNFSQFHIGGKMDLLILYFILEHEDDEKGHVFGNSKIFEKEAEENCLRLIKDLDVVNIEEIKLEEYVEFFHEKWKE